MSVLQSIRLVAAAGFTAMATAIVGAFSVASFTAEGSTILDLTWGRVTLLDIYLAFLLGWLWIAYRERSAARAGAWLVATLVTGSLALFAYLFVAASRARTTTELVLGPRRLAELGEPLVRSA